MPSSKSKIWYSFFDRNDYKGEEPFFFNTQNLPWANLLEEKYSIVKKELENLLQDKTAFQAYFNTSIVTRKYSWKTISLKWWDIFFWDNQKKCPETAKLLRQIPNLVSASFNMLEPGANILPHNGDTNSIYRCHFGLTIPGTLPECGFKVGEESRNWEEGKILVFCDAHKHTAWNLTDKPRFILLFDVVMDKFSSERKLICSNVLGSLFLQKRLEFFPFLLKMPLKLQHFIHFIIKSNILWYVPFRNFITKIGYYSVSGNGKTPTSKK